MGKLIEAVKCAEIISEKLNIPLTDLVDVFAEIPTADVVEVVRCKNCKHIGHELRFRKYSCKLYQMPYCSENDFCSYGKRKDT